MRRILVLIVIIMSVCTISLKAEAAEYYGDQLTSIEHQIYQEFCEQRIDYRASDAISIHIYCKEIFGQAPEVVNPYIDLSVRRALVAFMHDYPLYATTDMNCNWTFSGSEIDLKFSPADIYPKANLDIDKCLHQIAILCEKFRHSGNRFAQISSICEFMLMNYSYSISPLTRSHSVASLLLDEYGNEGVCSAFSGTFKLFCDSLDIPCIVVSGICNFEAHSWNLVQLDDGLWYSIDITQAKTHPDTSIDFLLIGASSAKWDPLLLQDGIAPFSFPSVSSSFFYHTDYIVPDFQPVIFDYYNNNQDKVCRLLSMNSVPYLLRDHLDINTDTQGVDITYSSDGYNLDYSRLSPSEDLSVQIILSSPYLTNNSQIVVPVDVFPIVDITNNEMNLDCLGTNIGSPIKYDANIEQYNYLLHSDNSGIINNYTLSFSADSDFPKLPILCDGTIVMDELSNTYQTNEYQEYWYNNISNIRFNSYCDLLSTCTVTFSFPFESNEYYLYSRINDEYRLVSKQWIDSSDCLMISHPSEDMLLTTSPLISNKKIAWLIILLGSISLAISIVLFIVFRRSLRSKS